MNEIQTEHLSVISLCNLLCVFIFYISTKLYESYYAGLFFAHYETLRIPKKYYHRMKWGVTSSPFLGRKKKLRKAPQSIQQTCYFHHITLGTAQFYELCGFVVLIFGNSPPISVLICMANWQLKSSLGKFLLTTQNSFPESQGCFKTT